MSNRVLPLTYRLFRMVWVLVFLLAIATMSLVAYVYLIQPVFIPWFVSVYPGLGGS